MNNRVVWGLFFRQQLSHVEMFVEGSYDFLHDAFSDECSLKQARWSSIRNNSIKKFLIALTKFVLFLSLYLCKWYPLWSYMYPYDVYLPLFKWSMHSEHSVKFYEENYSRKVSWKRFGKESLQYNTNCKRNTFYMKWGTDLRV